jgi:hypothetical protein
VFSSVFLSTITPQTSYETLRNLTFPLSTFPRRDQTKAQARANNVGPCGSAFVPPFSTFPQLSASFLIPFCRRRCKRACNTNCV